LCCGRTFLSVGLVEQAKREAQRLLDTLLPYADAGVPIIGLEPSCLLTLRDEIPALLPGQEAARLSRQAMLLEEFLDDEDRAKPVSPRYNLAGRQLVVHGHCHQKAFGVMGPMEKVLGMIEGAETRKIESSCCGMAGAFGYGAETVDVSLAMAELDLLPAVRQVDDDAIIVANGTSCRHQIADGSGRSALHLARVLDMALAESAGEDG
jgi:Fe-S oxidoreductase